jgi:phospholipid/cholesterol/gamma-HCH transport system permease protein
LSTENSKKASAALSATCADSAEIALSGAWLNLADRREALAVLDQISKSPGLKRMMIRDGGITEWDSSLIIFLRSLHALSVTSGCSMDVSGLPEGIQRLLNLANAVPERKGARRAEQKVSIATMVGNRTLRGLRDFGDSVRFLGELTVAFIAMAKGKAR